MIPQVGSVVAKVANACAQCRVAKSQPRCPRMAALPVQRVTPSLWPFWYVRIDYFVAAVMTRDVFTCLVVRTFHLDLAHSLTTQSCLMAVTRFGTNRGPTLEISFDNGTDFKEANREMVCDINEDCAGN